MKILLQPCSGKEAMSHFEDTIENGVSFTLLEKHLPIEESIKLSDIKSKRIKTWGFVLPIERESRSEWNNINKGDIVLFYKNKGFYYMAKVHSKVHNKRLAEELWGIDYKGRPWEYIYFIEEGKAIEVPYNPKILKKKDGKPYSPKHIMRSAILLDGENRNSMWQYIKNMEGDLVEEDIEEPTEADEEVARDISIRAKNFEDIQKELEALEDKLKNQEPKVRVRVAKSISRNSKLTRLVKEKAKYICEICGEPPFVKKNGEFYAEAHHVQEVSRGGVDLPHNLICVCPICHRVIHYGSQESLKRRQEIGN